MNQEIKHLYEGLDQLHRKNIRTFFQQSPKMLLYIDLLEQEQQLNTNKAVNFIYEEELKDTPRNILINRFYKLRKKIRLWLLKKMKNSPICLTIEEQELAFLRLMVIKNEHVYALEHLKILEEKCWENNIFELLPEVIQLIFRSMHASQVPNKDEQEQYLSKLQEAIELKHHLQNLNYYINYLYANIQDYSNVVETIRRKLKKLKQYPRFTMLYHFIAFSSGVFREDLVQTTSNAMTRHLNQFNQYKATYPNMPVSDFEPFHREKMDIHFCMKEAVFWYYKQKPKKSYAAIKKRKQMLQDYPNIHLRTSSAELHNLIYFCLNAEAYDDALEYIAQLKDYQTSNVVKNLDSPYFIYEMFVYVNSFPLNQYPSPLELIAQVSQFLVTAEQDSAWIYGTLAEFCILYGQFDQAQKALEQPDLKALYQNYGVDIQTDKLLIAVQNKNLTALRELSNLLHALSKESALAKYKFHYKTLRKIAQYYLKTLP